MKYISVVSFNHDDVDKILFLNNVGVDCISAHEYNNHLLRSLTQIPRGAKGIRMKAFELGKIKELNAMISGLKPNKMASGTMSGMSDEHLIASVDPQTDLEKELYRRFCEASDDAGFARVAYDEGFGTPEDLKSYLDQPECPSKEWLEEVLDDVLYLIETPCSTDARGLYDKLKRLQGELI